MHSDTGGKKHRHYSSRYPPEARRTPNKRSGVLTDKLFENCDLLIQLAWRIGQYGDVP
jgi:hypothetical protein